LQTYCSHTNKTVLVPTNDDVDCISEDIHKIFIRKARIYLSVDSVDWETEAYRFSQWSFKLYLMYS